MSEHIPVLLEECMEALALKDGGIYFDGTLGGAKHSKEILARSNARLIATDLDGGAVEAARRELEEFAGRFTLIHDNFKNFDYIMDELGVPKIDGALLDLGFSSDQLADGRGLAYMAENDRLDMRLNRDGGFTAYDVVNGYSEDKLKKVLYEYGEERFAPQIAESVCRARKLKPVETTGELVRIIESSVPRKFVEGHPAKKTFQAIRIEVNGELTGLGEAIKNIALRLKKGGRLAVITFHSLEDRIVKNAFRDLESDCVCDKSLPICVCGRRREIRTVNKKPIVAGTAEINSNPRAKSAKLRVAERV